jgi:hypothetical protein
MSDDPTQGGQLYLIVGAALWLALCLGLVVCTDPYAAGEMWSVLVGQP